MKSFVLSKLLGYLPELLFLAYENVIKPALVKFVESTENDYDNKLLEGLDAFIQSLK